ncbi:MAG TPA: phosphotransferase [Polyangia bacterium]|nr:phosphotransferase [Polyangia bacterium]
MLSTQEQLSRALLPIAFEIAGGRSRGTVRTLKGDASNRRYHRVTLEGGSPATLIVMELGDNPMASEEASKSGPAAELPFINVLRYLERGGIGVPKLYRYEDRAGLLFLEDLGDTTLESVVQTADSETRRRYYQVAIADLVTLQRYAAATPDPSCIAFGRAFDYDLLLWELHHFREWLLEADRAARLAAAEQETVATAFADIARLLADQPRGFVHRDYQSRNLMVQPGLRLRLIDFQDALLGTRAYDLVALLRDSYVELEPALLEDLIGEYVWCAQVPDAAAFRRLFDLQTLQRKLKDAGRFVFIDRVKKNPSFLVSIPASLRAVRSAFERLPELAPLRRVLGRYVPELS